MDERALRGLHRLAVLASDRALDVRRQSPRTRERTVVACRLEDRDRYSRGGKQLLRPAARLAEHTNVRELEASAELGAAIACDGPDVRCCREPCSRFGEPAGTAKRDAELAQQLEPEGVTLGQELRRPFEELEGSRDVAALPGLDPCRAEACPRPVGEPTCVLVEPAEVGPAAVGLLEVVAEELVGPVAKRVRQTLVQVRPLGLGQARVRNVADEDMVKAKAPAGRRSDEPAAREPGELVLDLAGVRVRREGDECVERELPPDHGSALEQAAPAGRQPVEPAREEKLERRRHSSDRSALGRVCEELLRIQRVSLGDVGDASADSPAAGVFAGDRDEQAAPSTVVRFPPVCASISATGKYVAPSAYETQRPTRTVASSRKRSTSSPASRVLPMPASPTTVTTAHRRSSRAAPNLSRRTSSSASRSTMGASGRRSIAGGMGSASAIPRPGSTRTCTQRSELACRRRPDCGSVQP